MLASSSSALPSFESPMKPTSQYLASRSPGSSLGEISHLDQLGLSDEETTARTVRGSDDSDDESVNEGWDDMDSTKQAAAETLGWTAAVWDEPEGDTLPAGYERKWIQLAEEERLAAAVLGYDSDGEVWDAERNGDSQYIDT